MSRAQAEALARQRVRPPRRHATRGVAAPRAVRRSGHVSNRPIVRGELSGNRLARVDRTAARA